MISTMIKYTFLKPRMTKVLKLNLSLNQELKKQEKLLTFSIILAFLENFGKATMKSLKEIIYKKARIFDFISKK